MLTSAELTPKLLNRLKGWTEGKELRHVKIERALFKDGWDIWIYDSDTITGVALNSKNKGKDFDKLLEEDKIESAKAQLVRSKKILGIE